MNWLSAPWVELTVAVPLAGAAVVAAIRNPVVAGRWTLGFTVAALACSVVPWVGLYLPQPAWRWAVMTGGRPLFAVDELSGPLLPLVALLHVLTVLATARTKMNRVSFTGHLTGEAVRLATFACVEPWPLVALLAAGVVPPCAELLKRGKPTRVFVVHMLLFVALAAAGWAGVAASPSAPPTWATLALLAAVLVRSGNVPFHLWVADLFEHATFGTALLFVTPLTGVYMAIRLVLPVAPDWVLGGIAVVSLVTALYAAGMATVQREARRFFAYLFLSHASLVLVGLELHTPVSLTGALALWFAVILALGGLGLTLRALESRFGRLSLSDFHGLYEHSPALAICFLLTGLGSVGFPATLGFVAADLLVDGAVEANVSVGVVVVLAAALNGIAVVRAYFLLFTGARHVSTVSLRITARERFAVLALAALVLGGGLVPQPSIVSRHDAAEAILKGREARLGPPRPAER